MTISPREQFFIPASSFQMDIIYTKLMKCGVEGMNPMAGGPDLNVS
jgi:hypothetical protein